jgi:hypothetical protein
LHSLEYHFLCSLGITFCSFFRRKYFINFMVDFPRPAYT